MKTLKKWITTILALTCICSMAVGVVACDDEEVIIPDGSSIESSVESSVESTSSDSVEDSDSTEDLTPDGSNEKPYPLVFLSDESWSVTVTLPASTSYYYTIAHPWGRTFIVEGEEIELQYTDVEGTAQTLTPADGKIEVALGDGEEKDVYEVVKLLLVNKEAADNELKLSLPVAAGSEPAAAIAVALDTQTTAKVKGAATVYYTWTATATGTLSISSTYSAANLSMYNEQTYRQTGEGENSLAVNAGDKILIYVSVAQSDSALAGETVDVPFILTLSA